MMFLIHFSINFLANRIARHHTWGYSDCLCPAKRMSGLNELKCLGSAVEGLLSMKLKTRGYCLTGRTVSSPKF